MKASQGGLERCEQKSGRIGKAKKEIKDQNQKAWHKTGVFGKFVI
jgi:hypothetical protein